MKRFANASDRWRVWGLLILVAAPAGCAWWPRRQAPPLPAPAVTWTVSHFAGTPLSGPRPDATLDGEPWHVTLQAAAVVRAPRGEYQPVGPMARLVVGSDTANVLAPSSRIVYAARMRRLGQDDDLATAIGGPADAYRFPALRGAVAAGATARFEMRTDPDAGRLLEMQIARRTDDRSFELALISDEKDEASGKRIRELVLLDQAMDQDVTRLAFFVPMTFRETPARGVVMMLEIDAAAFPDSDVAARMQADVEKSAALVRALPAFRPPDAGDLVLARAIEAAAGDVRRGSLALLADLTDAALTQTVLRVADDKVVDLIGAQVQSRLPALASQERKDVAWLLDRSTIAALASLRQEDAPLLTPVQGVLSIYAGEAGRQIDVLHSLASEAASSDDLMNRIIAEHFILLEESSPALRVRAFDWLAARGQAPAGYDPLAPAAQRRTALERMREQPSTTTAPTADTRPNSTTP